MQIVADTQTAMMHLICQALPKSVQRQAFGYIKSGSFGAVHFKRWPYAVNLKGLSLQNSAAIRLEMFRVLNHRQQSEN